MGGLDGTGEGVGERRIPSLSAAMRSTWPIFGILAVIQQNLGWIYKSDPLEGYMALACIWKHVARHFLNPPGILYWFFVLLKKTPAHTLEDFGVLEMCGELPFVHVVLPFVRMLPPWPPRKLLKLGAGASAAPGARLRDEVVGSELWSGRMM